MSARAQGQGPLSQAEWEAQRRAATEALPDLVEKIGLPKILLPYQARAVSLLDSASTSVLFIEKSRRIGMTWGLAAYAVLRAGRAREAGGMDVMYISFSQEMTREFIDACAMWARAFNQAASAVEEHLFADRDKAGDRSIAAFRIRFASGFEIMALSSAPRSLRGKQGVVIIDEAAFVDDLGELLKAALAFLMWGGQVVVCSTHDGAENPFNAHVQDILAGRLPYKHMRVDLDDALREGLYQRIGGPAPANPARTVWQICSLNRRGGAGTVGLFQAAATHSGSKSAKPFGHSGRFISAARRAWKGVTLSGARQAPDISRPERCARGIGGGRPCVTGKDWSPEAEAAWRQEIIDFYGEGADEELFCIPSLGSGAWLPAPLIEARMTARDAPILRLELPPDYLQRPELEQKSLMTPFLEELEEALGRLDLAPRYAGGFDFARVADLSVFDLLAVEAGLKRMEALSVEMRGVPGQEQIRVVGMILEHVKARLLGAAFDATGMGWIVAEEMGRRFGLRESEDGPGLIWAVKFTEEWYRLEMPPLKAAFEDDRIAIAPDEEHLADIRAARLVRGTPRVPPLREGVKGKKRHGAGSGPTNPARTVRQICSLNRRCGAGTVVLFQAAATHSGGKSAGPEGRLEAFHLRGLLPLERGPPCPAGKKPLTFAPQAAVRAGLVGPEPS